MAKKKKTVTKSTKTNKSKFSLKKLNFKKNWKKLSYLGLAAFLAVSSIGYGSWKILINRADVATAGSNVLVFQGLGIGERWTVWGCRIPGAYFPVQGNIYMYNQSNRKAHMYINGRWAESILPNKFSASHSFTSTSSLYINDGSYKIGIIGTQLANKNFCY